MVDIDDIVRFAASIDAGGFAERHSFPKETVEEARTGYLSAIGDAVRYVRYELGAELGTETGADGPGRFAADVLVPYFNMLNCMARWREIIHETEKELVDLGKRVADRFQQTFAAPDTRTPGGEGILWEYTGRIRGSEYSFWADYSLRLPAGLNEVLKGAGSNIRIVEERDLQDHYQIKIFELTGGGGFIERTVGRPGADNTILRRFLQFGSEIHDRSHIVEEGLIRNILTEKKALVALGARGYWWTSKLVRRMKSEQEAAARILLLQTRKSDPAQSLVSVLTGDNIVGLLGRDFKEYPTKAHRTAQLKRCRMIFQEGLRSYRPRLSHLFDYGAAAYLKEGAEGPLPRTSLLGLVEWLAYYHADMHTEESFRFILRRATMLLRRDMAEPDGYSKSQLREYVNRQIYRRFISGSYGDSGLE
jgi:hypothetical protein